MNAIAPVSIMGLDFTIDVDLTSVEPIKIATRNGELPYLYSEFSDDATGGDQEALNAIARVVLEGAMEALELLGEIPDAALADEAFSEAFNSIVWRIERTPQDRLNEMRLITQWEKLCTFEKVCLCYQGQKRKKAPILCDLWVGSLNERIHYVKITPCDPAISIGNRYRFLSPKICHFKTKHEAVHRAMRHAEAHQKLTNKFNEHRARRLLSETRRNDNEC